MKTKILIYALAAATLAIGSAACGKKSSGNGAPAFPDPPLNPTQIDRVGRPALNTIVHKVFDTSGASSDAFNGLNPSMDVIAAGGTNGILAKTVKLAHACPAPAVAGALLPDVLGFNVASDGNYAKLNGRALADDVFDITLGALYVNSAGTPCAPLTYLAGDHIAANDVAFSTTFPFLAAPH